MKKLILSLLAFVGLQAAYSQCNELFISEYVEGWSNNKAIEIFNPTNNAIELSDYELWRFSNGAASPSSEQKIKLVPHSLPAHTAYVVVIDQRDTSGSGNTAPAWDSLNVTADLFLCPVYATNNTMYFNGNDAIVLVKSGGAGTPIDIFGKPGEDPAAINGASSSNDPNFGWPTNQAVSWTANHTLIRKSSVDQGVAMPPANFVPSMEWDSLPANTFSNLGVHNCSCGSDNILDRNPISISLASVNDVFSKIKAETVLYPNPVNESNYSYIKAPYPVKNLSIIDITGKIVREIKPNTNTVGISTNEMIKGVYFVKLNFDEGVEITKKLVVR